MNSLLSSVRLALISGLAASAGFLRAEESGKPKSDAPPASVLQRYDRNKDGKLGEEEKARWEAEKAARRDKEKARRAEMLEKYDADKDGKLSEEEKAAAKLEWQKDRAERDAEKMKERAAREKAGRQAAEGAQGPGDAKPANAPEMGKGKGPRDKPADGESGTMMGE